MSSILIFFFFNQTATPEIYTLSLHDALPILTRYIGKYGTQRVRKAVLRGTLGPYLVKAADNPDGVDASVFDGLKAAIKADRPTTLLDFLHNFYNYDVLGGKLVSERVVEDNWNVAVGASATGTLGL